MLQLQKINLQFRQFAIKIIYFCKNFEMNLFKFKKYAKQQLQYVEYLTNYINSNVQILNQNSNSKSVKSKLTMHSGPIRIFLFLLSLINSQIDPDYSYDVFMVQFNRTYTGQQYQDHKKIFDANYQIINQKRRQGEDLEVNQFIDWNETQINSLLNFKRDETTELGHFVAGPQELIQTPPYFDMYRKKKYITSIKNQGQCGSCYSFAITAQYQAIYAILTGRKIDLAEQYIVECQENSGGCEGGYTYHAGMLVRITGIPLQEEYPYKPESGSFYSNLGKPICKQANSSIKLPKNVERVRKYVNTTEKKIEQLLVKYGPLTVAVTTNTPSFLFAGTSGLINHCDKAKLDHAVLLVGYNETHWFIKNSWGNNWGNEGFGYILKSNDCRIRQEIVAMQADLSTNAAEENSNTTLQITLRSKSGYGWGGNIVQFFQNNITISKFGENFSYGYFQGPFNISFNSHIEVITHVIIRGKTPLSQLGMTIKDANGIILQQYFPGNLNGVNPINDRAKIGEFCPTDECYSIINKNIYYITLEDLMGDTWEGTVLTFSPPGSIQSFTLDERTQFKGPIRVTFAQNIKNIKILVKSRGANWGEVRYRVEDFQRKIITERNIFQPIVPDRILTSFRNKKQDRSRKSKLQNSLQNEVPYIEDQKQNTLQNKISNTQSQNNPKLILAIILLANFLTITLLGFLFLLIKYRKLVTLKQNKQFQYATKIPNNKISNQFSFQNTTNQQLSFGLKLKSTEKIEKIENQ